jgi:hypothetical protein
MLVITNPQRQQLKQKNLACEGGCVRPSPSMHSSVASFTSLTFFLYIKIKVWQSLYRPTTGPGDSRRLRLPDFETAGSLRW